jgi:hypothetical protein
LAALAEAKKEPTVSVGFDAPPRTFIDLQPGPSRAMARRAVVDYIAFSETSFSETSGENALRDQIQ